MNDNNSGIDYTSEMEKAMHQSHNMGYAEYERSVEHKLQVEKNRKKSYQESKRLVNEVNRQVHR